MRRLRRSAETSPAPHTYTAHAQLKIKTAASFLTWLAANNTTLTDCHQADIDHWPTTSPSTCHVRDFLPWASERGHCHQFTVPTPHLTPMPRPTPSTAGHWYPSCSTTTGSTPPTGSPAAWCCSSASNNPGSPP